ncbi:hypothetical protein [Phenylobacterium sp. J367]|uniref:hypothetical protein n=1 Tax=Phenylobacterium sp. J367 TaxID=2898435 RepID=UPI0021507521|nr:hypothetical protein [Phenylobacterium sp. J367]MCR5878640.1 hypothetical protein [Phenylobacterium sp. J367]
METEQDRLRAADLALAEAQEAARTAAPDAGGRLTAWLAASERLERALAPKQARSLFDPDRLAAAANRRLPPGAS